jgi:hypothetical protein
MSRYRCSYPRGPSLPAGSRPEARTNLHDHTPPPPPQHPPGQFALSTTKLQRALAAYEQNPSEPFSVRQVGEDLVLTDGHHRAIVALLMGVVQVDVYLDTGDWDWEIWERCVAECRQRGVTRLDDLIGRMLPHDGYEQEWCACCDHITEQVEAERAAGHRP